MDKNFKPLTLAEMKEKDGVVGEILDRSKKDEEDLHYDGESSIFNSMGDIRNVDTGGRRNENRLTDDQKAEVLSYAERLKLPSDKVVFLDHEHTGYWSGADIVVIGTDVLPLENISKVPNDNISMRGTIAHEVIGHGESVRGGFAFDPRSPLDEAQASLRAAKLAPGLNVRERNDLARDAMRRLIDANINYRDVKHLFNITERVPYVQDN